MTPIEPMDLAEVRAAARLRGDLSLPGDKSVSHRALILAFYNFVRTGDDIADHTSLPPQEKLDRLDLLEAEFGAPAPDLCGEPPEVHADLRTGPWKGDQYNHPHV